MGERRIRAADSDCLFDDAYAERLIAHNHDDTVAGGGNHVPSAPGDNAIGETIDDEFVFNAPWVNV